MGLPWRVLVVCCNTDCRRTLAEVLGLWHAEVISASMIGEARKILAEHPISLVLCESHLPDGSFADLLDATASRKPAVRLIAILQDDKEYADAIRRGAFDAILVPCRRSDAQWVIIQAMREEKSPPGKSSEVMDAVLQYKRS